MGAIYSQGKPKLRKENDFSGGVNQAFNPFSIADNQSVDEYGFDTDDHPFISTAKGRTAYGSSGGAVTRMMAAFGHNHLVRAVGTKLQYNSSGTTWTDIAGTYADTDWDYTNFEAAAAPALIMTNGTDPVKYWNGSTLADLGSSVPRGKYITNDTVRLWIAEGDILHFSKFQDASDFTATENAGSVQYFTERGGDITGVKNFYGDKYVWKKDSFAVVQGTSYYNFRLFEISNDIGCVNNKTIQEVGDSLFWLGERNVYMFNGGKPEPIGDAVRTVLDTVNKAHIDKCCSISDGVRYYLCLVTGNATEPNVRLVYDPRYGIWRVPGRNENYRYSAILNVQTYVGDSVGQTYKFNDGTTNNGAPLSWSITSKPYDEEFPEAEKAYSELHFQAYFPSGSTLTVGVSVKDRGEDFTNINYDPLGNASDVLNKNLIVPFDQVPLTHWMRYRLSGTGFVTHYRTQRYFRAMRVQR